MMDKLLQKAETSSAKLIVTMLSGKIESVGCGQVSFRYRAQAGHGGESIE